MCTRPLCSSWCDVIHAALIVDPCPLPLGRPRYWPSCVSLPHQVLDTHIVPCGPAHTSTFRGLVVYFTEKTKTGSGCVLWILASLAQQYLFKIPSNHPALTQYLKVGFGGSLCAYILIYSSIGEAFLSLLIYYIKLSRTYKVTLNFLYLFRDYLVALPMQIFSRLSHFRGGCRRTRLFSLGVGCNAICFPFPPVYDQCEHGHAASSSETGVPRYSCARGSETAQWAGCASHPGPGAQRSALWLVAPSVPVLPESVGLCSVLWRGGWTAPLVGDAHALQAPGAPAGRGRRVDSRGKTTVTSKQILMEESHLIGEAGSYFLF